MSAFDNNMTKGRRSEYDVTDSVQVSSPERVCAAVVKLLLDTYPGEDFSRLEQGYRDFERLFTGQYPGYLGCDTVYHDIQHTLDMSLAVARLVAGYDRSHEESERLGPRRAMLGLITALFHDAGYIRRATDRAHQNGAEFTLYHVTRSAEFLADYLPKIGLAADVSLATRIVHFTGFEVQFDQIQLDDPKDLLLGHLLGTADLMAQMADRCYLEKCRDRLYPEFVLGGVAQRRDPNGQVWVKYRSGDDLLRQTPDYYRTISRKRLDEDFRRAHRYVEALFDGENPYMSAIDNNLRHLERVLTQGAWRLLRRQPPCFTWTDDPVQRIADLADQHLQEMTDSDNGEPGR